MLGACVPVDGWHEQTTWHLRKGAQPWHDLPETLESMREAAKNEGVDVREVFDVHLEFWAPWDQPSGNGIEENCLYHYGGTIQIRPTSELAIDDCLPHEIFAHHLPWILREGNFDCPSWNPGHCDVVSNERALRLWNEARQIWLSGG